MESETMIDSIKLLIISLENKKDKNEHDNQVLETAKFKLKALENKEIIVK